MKPMLRKGILRRPLPLRGAGDSGRQLVRALHAKSGMATDRFVREQIASLLDSPDAHLRFDDAVKGFPVELRGTRPQQAPHSPWELLEHLRIAQWDILEFTRNPKHVSPAWPSGYWPESPEPPSGDAWDASVAAFREDLQALIAIARDHDTDLEMKIPGGDGQTVLRELLLTADHNAYHLGQLVMVRRMLERK